MSKVEHFLKKENKPEVVEEFDLFGIDFDAISDKIHKQQEAATKEAAKLKHTGDCDGGGCTI